MEIATLIFILSFLAIVATLVVSATRYMCEQKGEVVRNSYGLTKEKSEQISKLTELSYTEKYEPLVTICSGNSYKPLTYRDGSETQEKWKLTIPKHSTRIKNRNKRKGHGKGVRGKKK